MMIRAVKDYFDKELQKSVKKDDCYEVSEDRGNYIINAGFAVADDAPAMSEEKPKRARKKKAE